MPSVYLSGSITANEECFKWRDKVTTALNDAGITCLDPLRGKDIKSLSKDGLTSSSPVTKRGAFVHRDILDMERADIMMIVWWGDPGRQSIGTWYEFGWFKNNGGKVIVVDLSEGAQISSHPFVFKFADAMYKDLDEAIEYVKYLFS